MKKNCEKFEQEKKSLILEALLGKLNSSFANFLNIMSDGCAQGTVLCVGIKRYLTNSPPAPFGEKLDIEQPQYFLKIKIIKNLTL